MLACSTRRFLPALLALCCLPACGDQVGEGDEASTGESNASDSATQSGDEGGGATSGSASGDGDSDTQNEGGDGDAGETGIPDPVFPDSLWDLPGVVSVDPIEGGFRIGFEQPIDHWDENSETFVQYLSLRSDGFDGPMIMRFSGYYDYLGTSTGQLGFLVPNSNGLSVEHRYFGNSVPEPTEWQFLTVEQAAADHHAIIESFKLLYDEPWLSTGASKGGQTVLELEQLYPEDIDAVVALVAPVIPALYDEGFDAFVDDLASTTCGQQARAVHTAMLERRDELLALAAEEASLGGASFDRVGLELALDIAIVEWEFIFWQYTSDCADLPDPQGSAQALYAAMGSSSPLTYSDDSLSPFMPFFYQCRAQLGYPGMTDAHLDTSLFPAITLDYLESLTPAEATLPEYDSNAMTSLAQWVQSDADQVVMIYGAFDPWSARAVDPGDNEGVLYYMLEGENHGANIFKLSTTQRQEVCSALQEWTGLVDLCSQGFVDTPPVGRLGPARL